MERRRLAVGLLVGSALVGFGLAMGRVAQGAHFLSHNLWSAAVCWIVTLLLFDVLRRLAHPPSPCIR